MENLEEIDSLIDELSAGNISAAEAVYKIAQAQAMMKRLYASLGNISAAIVANPAHLQNVRTNRLAEQLFSRTNGKG